MSIHSVLVTITSSEDGESKDDNDEPAEEVNKNVLPPAEDPYMLVRNKKKAEESMEQTPHLRASEEEEEDNDASESKEDKNEESNDISPNTIEDHLTVMNKKSETEESEEEEKSPLDSIDNSSLNNDLGDKANPDEFITSKSNESEEETKDMPSKNTDDNDLPAVSKNEEEEEDKPKTEEENILNESEVNNKESERPSIDSSSEPEGEETYQTLTSITVPTSKEDRSYLTFPPLHDLSIVLGIRANNFNQISYLCKMGCPAFDEKKRDGKGIYILAYSNEESTAEAYYKDALQTAQKISNLDNSVWIFLWWIRK